MLVEYEDRIRLHHGIFCLIKKSKIRSAFLLAGNIRGKNKFCTKTKIYILYTNNIILRKEIIFPVSADKGLRLKCLSVALAAFMVLSIQNY